MLELAHEGDFAVHEGDGAVDLGQTLRREDLHGHPLPGVQRDALLHLAVRACTICQRVRAKGDKKERGEGQRRREAGTFAENAADSIVAAALDAAALAVADLRRI